MDDANRRYWDAAALAPGLRIDALDDRVRPGPPGRGAPARRGRPLPPGHRRRAAPRPLHAHRGAILTTSIVPFGVPIQTRPSATAIEVTPKSGSSTLARRRPVRASSRRRW